MRFALTFLLPVLTYYDTGVFSVGQMHGDGSQRYGLEAEVLNSKGQVIYQSTVSERYTPAVPEMVAVTLVPGACAVRCTIFGEDGLPQFEDAQFQIVPFFPPLSIQQEGTNVVISWEQGYGNWWELETRTTEGWVASSTTVPASGSMGLFRLRKKQ